MNTVWALMVNVCILHPTPAEQERISLAMLSGDRVLIAAAQKLAIPRQTCTSNFRGNHNSRRECELAGNAARVNALPGEEVKPECLEVAQ